MGAHMLNFADGVDPHLFIFPSKSGRGHHIQDVDGRMFLNPGIIGRGAMGSFAEFHVHPPHAKKQDEGLLAPLLLKDRLRVEIRKFE